MIYEALCSRCGETFNPTPTLAEGDHTVSDAVAVTAIWFTHRGFTPDDLTHGVKADGTECGGLGRLQGSWSISAQLEVVKAPKTRLDTLLGCYEALMVLRKKFMRGDLSLDDFWTEAEVIVDHARALQQGEVTE